MSLITCPECAKEVSTAALQCPGCGHPLRNAPGKGPSDSPTPKSAVAVPNAANPTAVSIIRGGQSKNLSPRKFLRTPNPAASLTENRKFAYRVAAGLLIVCSCFAERRYHLIDSIYQYVTSLQHENGDESKSKAAAQARPRSTKVEKGSSPAKLTDIPPSAFLPLDTTTMKNGAPSPSAFFIPNKSAGMVVGNGTNQTEPKRPNTKIGVLDHPEGISLEPNWDKAMSGDSLTLRDLGSLLSQQVQRGRDTGPHPDLKIYGEVTYLMPLERVKEVLGLAKRINSKNKMASSGFPASSLYHYGFTGQYEGIYNQLYIITDRADQVVSIQLVAEHPHGDIPDVKFGDWHVYNFVNARHKSLSTLQIGYSVRNMSDLLVIEGVLRDSGHHTARPKGVTSKNTQATSHGSTCLESIRWYLPAPLAGLILECVGKQIPGVK